MSLDKLKNLAEKYSFSNEIIEQREKDRLSFIEKFPIKKLKNLSIDEYCAGTNKNSFCYWLEFKKIGFGIGGGNASKFGIYKTKNQGKDIYATNYGKNKTFLDDQSAIEYYSKLLSKIIKALEYAEKNQIEQIRKLEIPIWNMVLQKILSNYYPDKFLSIGSPNVIIKCARELGLEKIELSSENSIQVNFEIKNVLSNSSTYSNWPYEKIGSFIWETFDGENEKSNSENRFYKELLKAKPHIEKAGFKYKALRENSRYVWIEDSNNIIGRKPAHYEFISRRGILFLELHFEEKKSQDAFFKNIQHLPQELEWIDWEGSKSIRHKHTYSLNDQNLSSNLVKDLIEFDILIGDKVRSVLKSKSKKYWLYAPGENAYLWDEFYQDGILGLGWDEIGDLSQYKSRDEIKKALVDAYGGTGSKKNDVSANDDFLNKIKIGDVIIVKKGRRELLGYGVVTSDYMYDKKRKKQQKTRKVDWKIKGNWSVDFNLVLKTLTDITKYNSEDERYDTYYEKLLGIMEFEQIQKDNRESFSLWLTKKYGEDSGTASSYIKAIDMLSQILSKELFETTDDNYLELLYKDLIKEQRNKDGKYFRADAPPSYGSHGFYSASIKSYREFLKTGNQKESIVKNEIINFPLNTILYGPPGTGKTYNTILKAAQIIENRTIDSYDEALEVFKANLHDKIEFITFHQNYSYEDFIQGLRPDTENDNQLTFERKDGIFKEIADKALRNLRESEKPQLSKRPFFEVFNEFINPLSEGEVEEIEVKMKRVSYFITAVSNKSIDFRKASGGTAHTLSIATLNKMYLAESYIEIQGLAIYYRPLIAALLKLGKTSSGKKEQIKPQNHVIIIDEINRANISRVFGELITLIEPDKRSHGKIPLEAKLPSGDPFIVPSNLFIIGTMNTADKSIALLDIALRRRFEFESMYPKYEIEGQEIYDVEILEKINKQIIKSKGHDFQIGHAYFMGENKDLVQRMNRKVIPLLLEYYMNDEKEVKSILNSAGLIIEENSWPIKISGKND